MRRLEIMRVADTEEAVALTVYDGERRIFDEVTDVSYELIHRLYNHHQFETVLDVGSGRGEHAATLRALGKTVTTLDPVYPADIRADLMEWETDETYDVVFCSHVLEHQRNPGAFLDALVERVKPGGLLAVSVPPVVSHHVTFGHGITLNAGYLIYHLVMAGLDCREVEVLTYAYNVSAIVRKGERGLPKGTWCREWDEVGPYFPPELQAAQKQNEINGAIYSLNWEPVLLQPPHINAGLPRAV